MKNDIQLPVLVSVRCSAGLGDGEQRKAPKPRPPMDWHGMTLNEVLAEQGYTTLPACPELGLGGKRILRDGVDVFVGRASDVWEWLTWQEFRREKTAEQRAWMLSRAHLEDGCEVGAMSPEFSAKFKPPNGCKLSDGSWRGRTWQGLRTCCHEAFAAAPG